MKPIPESRAPQLPSSVKSENVLALGMLFKDKEVLDALAVHGYGPKNRYFQNKSLISPNHMKALTYWHAVNEAFKVEEDAGRLVRHGVGECPVWWPIDCSPTGSAPSWHVGHFGTRHGIIRAADFDERPRLHPGDVATFTRRLYAQINARKTRLGTLNSVHAKKHDMPKEHDSGGCSNWPKTKTKTLQKRSTDASSHFFRPRHFYCPG